METNTAYYPKKAPLPKLSNLTPGWEPMIAELR